MSEGTGSKSAGALSKWVIFKANFKDLAGEEGQNKGKQREKERTR